MLKRSQIAKINDCGIPYLTTLGAHLDMNFSMSAGPKGAAPPLTVSTEDR